MYYVLIYYAMYIIYIGVLAYFVYLYFTFYILFLN